MRASIAGRSLMAPGGPECDSDVDLPWVLALSGNVDPIDPLLAVTGSIIDNGGKVLNDGLVPVESGKWGEFWGCLPADHLDEVGQLLGEGPGLGNPYDYQAMYRSIVKLLRSKGY